MVCHSSINPIYLLDCLKCLGLPTEESALVPVKIKSYVDTILQILPFQTFNTLLDTTTQIMGSMSQCGHTHFVTFLFVFASFWNEYCSFTKGSRNCNFILRMEGSPNLPKQAMSLFFFVIISLMSILYFSLPQLTFSNTAQISCEGYRQILTCELQQKQSNKR